MKFRLPLMFAFALALLLPGVAVQSNEIASSEDGKYFDADDNPTYKIGEDGTVDWFTYSGFRRYHSECHVCHGPDALGSSFAPGLAESLNTMDYEGFLEVVINGREKVGASDNSKMPSFGVNRNVICYLDDIYVYLKARSDGALDRGRPRKKEAKSDATREEENECLAD
ncbi:c-type cytochrome, methanol metabolism-related [Pelagibius sp. Alg239-R121]|uniref:c-type cytochrome, methanol metabolism-related n=1 Tax=Pelagibius sp. Alg239-R121 TaxID=2993448 RepID=UPI0024A768B6|nr:c-type cytochrome, methanol metabolism-related [Pelagibius sp. Alg239-R121]